MRTSSCIPRAPFEQQDHDRRRSESFLGRLVWIISGVNSDRKKFGFSRRRSSRRRGATEKQIKLQPKGWNTKTELRVQSDFSWVAKGENNHKNTRANINRGQRSEPKCHDRPKFVLVRGFRSASQSVSLVELWFSCSQCCCAIDESETGIEGLKVKSWLLQSAVKATPSPISAPEA